MWSAAKTFCPRTWSYLAKLASYGGVRPPMAQVAVDLALSPSQVHACSNSSAARLMDSNAAGRY